MAITTRHKKALKNLGKSSTEEEALLKAGYSPSYARAGQIKHTDGWQELMEKNLPDGLLTERHKELLNKREVYKIGHGENTEHEISDQPETMAVSKGLDMAYKLKGKYAPEKSINLTMEVEPSPEIKELASKLNELYRSPSVGGDGVEPRALDDKTQNQE